MTDKTVFEPEDFYVDLNYAPVKWDFEHLIGRKQQIQILQGTEPFYSENGAYLSLKLFPEVSVASINPNRAFLFSGKEGNGRYTLNTAFALYMYDRANPDFRYYSIPADQLKQKDNQNTSDDINLFFDKLDELVCKPAYEDYLLYFDLGDITRLTKNKIVADTLSMRISKLLRTESAMIIVTASNGKCDDQIPLSLKKVFLPVILDDPSYSDRCDYFNFFNRMNKSVQWGMSIEEMSLLTDGFTFLMMEYLIKNLYLWVQGEFNRKFEDETTESYLLGISEDIFFIPPEIIKNTAERIKSQFFTALIKSDNKTDNLMSVENPTVTHTVHEEKSKSDNNEDEDREIEVSKANSISEIRMREKSLPPAINMKAINQVHNYGPNILSMSNE